MPVRKASLANTDTWLHAEASASEAPVRRNAPVEELSPRELEIARLVASVDRRCAFAEGVRQAQRALQGSNGRSSAGQWGRATADSDSKDRCERAEAGTDSRQRPKVISIRPLRKVDSTQDC